MSTLRDVRLTAAITHEAPWYVARCLDVEVTSQGKTADAALENLREALELYFEDAPLPIRESRRSSHRSNWPDASGAVQATSR